ncbi:hypothetical protein [Microbispora triticiradicis]|nr:hypothetical protein [Microbispora triticiradicis]
MEPMEIRIVMPFNPAFHDPSSVAATEECCSQHGKDYCDQPPVASVYYPPNGRVSACARALHGIIDDAVSKSSQGRQ